MRTLQYYQQTYFFFSLVLFLAFAIFCQMEFRIHPSYPLPAQKVSAIETNPGLDRGALSPTQKDGGLRVISRR